MRKRSITSLQAGGIQSARGRVATSVARAEEQLTTVARLLAKELQKRGVGAFYAENASYFARPSRFQVERLDFRGDGALERARQAWAALGRA